MDEMAKSSLHEEFSSIMLVSHDSRHKASKNVSDYCFYIKFLGDSHHLDKVCIYSPPHDSEEGFGRLREFDILFGRSVVMASGKPCLDFAWL